jgi:poly-gamma-glutamate synthesis protein (capsule biosynthesis protein)
MKLFFCGDVMPGGVLPYQKKYITPELKGFMDGFDFRIGTLESAIGTDLPYDPVKMQGRANIVYARNEDFFRVKEMEFDVVSLANNHVWDLGEEGLKNTIRILKENGIQYCGAGMNIEEASKPAVIEKEGQRVAILAYCMYGNKYLGNVELAGKDKAGINPLDIDKVVEDIKESKRQYDKVIVLPHWGREYRYEPLAECITMAKKMVAVGADAVMGSHTHQIQPFMYIKGKPVCFSMGNFLFPDFYMQPPRPIWYPDSFEEVKNVKDVVGYPFPIEEPIRQVWNPVSRYGCVVSIDFSNSRKPAKVRYVHATDGNIEELCELPSEIRKSLRKTGNMIKYKPLRIIRKIKNRLR